MRTSIYTVLAVGIVCVAATVTLTKDGCVDASGFETCQNAVTKKTNACIGQAKKDGSQMELLACGCQDAVDNFNCYATHCWNQVWGCQYQEYMVEYFRICAIAKQPVPYFPAPNHAPAACSCNLGKIFFAFNGAIKQSAQCSSKLTSGDANANVQAIHGCNCCQVSGAFSRYIVAKSFDLREQSREHEQMNMKRLLTSPARKASLTYARIPTPSSLA